MRPHLRIERYVVPSGDLGTWDTLLVMRGLAREGVPHPLTMRAVRGIVQAGRQLDPGPGKIRAFLENRTRFRYDPVGVELLRGPDVQLGVIGQGRRFEGDCDDVAILGATLGLALGFPARFVAVGFDPRGPFEHVWTDLYHRGTWYDLDITRDAQPFPPSPRRRITLRV